LCPFTQQQCREAIRLGKNSWWRTASQGRPYRREEKAPGSESGRHIAKTQAEACVTKPQDRRTRETHDVDFTLPISDVTTLDEQVAGSVSNQRLVAQLSSFFGVVAVFLSCIGIYGLM
jgi:hypothetical protein